MSVALPIEEDPRFRRYTATQGQTVFSIPFPFQQNEDVAIQLFSNGAYVDIDRANFVISGAMHPEGGSVTFNAGRASGDIIVVVGAAVLDRLSSVVRDGRFASKLTDDELDRNRIIQQEQSRDIGRSFKAAYGSEGGTLIADTPSSLLNLDAQGNIVASETPINEKTLRELGDQALASLISQFGPIEVPAYDTRLAASMANIKPTIKVIRTGGYSSPNGFGGAVYIEGDGTLAGGFFDNNGRGFQLARQVLTPAMFGAPIDGIANATTAINAAIARAKAMGLQFIDGQGLRYRVPNRTAISNLYGVELQNTYLIEDVPGGDIQVNTYADKNQRSFGKEYLWALYNWIKITSNPIKVFAYGDSTMQAPSGWPNGNTPWQAFWQSMWPRLAKLKGFKQALVATNRGVGGQAVSGMDFAADLATGMQLMLIKYGINDATVSTNPDVALKTFAEELNKKLTDVRNSPNGDVYNLSIILVGASSTYDPASDRDASWFEKLRGVYEDAARKHRCFYFDTYGYMQDSRWAIGAWLDTAGLHPEAIGYWWIFAHLFNIVFPDYEMEYWRRNLNSNTPGAVFQPLNSHNRNEEYFNWGQNLNIATIPNGFPQHGGLLTLFQADRPGMQLLFPSDGKPNFNLRAYDTTSEGFGVWTGITQSIAFQNGWQEFDTAAYGSSYCVRTTDGDSRVRLCIRGGTALSAGSVIGVIPSGFRPKSIEQFMCFNLSGAVGRIDVTTAGNIRIVGGVTADMLNASFSFRAN